MKLAFIGLGKMGFPMAGHLARAGHEVTVYNRSPAKSELWCSLYEGRHAIDAADAVRDAAIVFICLGDIAATRALMLGAGGALSNMATGSILIDHASATPGFAREMASAAALQGVGCLDAPVTGGVPGAIAGSLGIMAGGDAAVFAAAKPVLQSYGQRVSLMGGAGCGHMAKLVNVICGTGMGQALAEGLAFAKRAGLDMDQLLEVLMAGSTRSYILEHKGQAMAAGVHLPASFTVDHALNNIRQTLAEAALLEARLPLLEMTGQFYAQIQAQGRGEWDTSALIEILR